MNAPSVGSAPNNSDTSDDLLSGDNLVCQRHRPVVFSGGDGDTPRCDSVLGSAHETFCRLSYLGRTTFRGVGLPSKFGR